MGFQKSHLPNLFSTESASIWLDVTVQTDSGRWSRPSERARHSPHATHFWLAKKLKAGTSMVVRPPPFIYFIGSISEDRFSLRAQATTLTAYNTHKIPRAYINVLVPSSVLAKVQYDVIILNLPGLRQFGHRHVSRTSQI